MQIAEMILKVLNIITLRPVIWIIIEISEILAIRFDPVCESCCHSSIVAHSASAGEQIFLSASLVRVPLAGVTGVAHT